MLYSKKINASHICPPKRNRFYWTEEMKIEIFGEILTLTCKTRVKVTFVMKTWNNPTVITHILPQLVSHKPMNKNQFFHILHISQLNIVAGKWKIKTAAQNQTSIMGLWGTTCGKMSVMTVGSFQVFTKIKTLISILHVKVHIFQKAVFVRGLSSFYFSLEDRYVTRLFS